MTITVDETVDWAVLIGNLDKKDDLIYLKAIAIAIDIVSVIDN